MNFIDVLLAKKINGGGGGGSATLINKDISANGTYNASSDNADGYKKVVVNVPTITPTGTLSVSANGTYDVTNYASASVDVPSSEEDLQSWFDKSIEQVERTTDDGRDGLPEYMFDGYTNLKKVDLVHISSVGGYCFHNCVALTDVNLPNTTSVGTYGFAGASSLQKLVLPKCTTAGSRAFSFATGSSKPAVFVAHVLETAGSDLFRGENSYFSKMDFPSLTTISTRAFYQGYYEDVILRSNSVVALSNTNGVGVGAGGGFASYTNVYVPQALISEYESATNWSTAKTTKGFSFVAIEGSIYETQYADGTPIGA